MMLCTVCSMQEAIHDVRLRRNLNLELVGVLRQRILDGTLAVGERFNEVHLSQEMGVSRTPLREALIVLAHEGFVTNEPRRGVFVNDLTVEEVMSLYPFRALLDPYALKLAGLPTAERLAELHDLNAEIAESCGDAGQTIELDSTWHAKLIGACPNLIVLDYVRQISLRQRRYEHAYMRESENVEVAVTDHQQILASLEEGDLRKACNLLGKNMERAEEPIVAWLRERKNT